MWADESTSTRRVRGWEGGREGGRGGRKKGGREGGRGGRKEGGREGGRGGRKEGGRSVRTTVTLRMMRVLYSTQKIENWHRCYVT